MSILDNIPNKKDKVIFRCMKKIPEKILITYIVKKQVWTSIRMSAAERARQFKERCKVYAAS